MLAFSSLNERELSFKQLSKKARIYRQSEAASLIPDEYVLYYCLFMIHIDLIHLLG
jgi:hypothetical protein